MTRSQQIAAFVIGGLLVVAGFYFIHVEITNGSPHTKHVYVFAGMVTLGVLVMFPAVLMEFVRTVVVAIPWSGKFGQRKEDVPMDEAPPGAAPGTPVPGVQPVPVVVAVPPVVRPNDHTGEEGP